MPAALAVENTRSVMLAPVVLVNEPSWMSMLAYRSRLDELSCVMKADVEPLASESSVVDAILLPCAEGVFQVAVAMAASYCI